MMKQVRSSSFSRDFDLLTKGYVRLFASDRDRFDVVIDPTASFSHGQSAKIVKPVVVACSRKLFSQ